MQFSLECLFLEGGGGKSEMDIIWGAIKEKHSLLIVVSLLRFQGGGGGGGARPAP
jgi:hypothetical protein